MQLSKERMFGKVAVAATAALAFVAPAMSAPVNYTLVEQQASPNTTWYTVACNGDCSTLIAGDYDDAHNISISKDGGKTWAYTKSGQREWYQVAMSSNGKLGGGTTTDGAYRTTDISGVWTRISGLRINTDDWYNVKMTPDGKKWVACGDNGVGIKYSADSGKTWVDTGADNTTGYYACDIADNGKFTRIAAATYNKGVYYGFKPSKKGSWTFKKGSGYGVDTGNWYSMAASTDGNTWYTARSGAPGGIFKSTNGGETWTPVYNETAGYLIYWVSCSTNGRVVSAVSGAGDFLLSNDFGATWQSLPYSPSPQTWYGGDISSDGTKLAGAAYAPDGNIWTGQQTGCASECKKSAKSTYKAAVTGCKALAKDAVKGCLKQVKAAYKAANKACSTDYPKSLKC